MSRDKIKRQLNFKPHFLCFSVCGNENSETLKLDGDELEAIYLADELELYHEECSKRMGISRPTFSRVLKSARKKVAKMLLYGKSIEIQMKVSEFKVAFATDDRVNLSSHISSAKYFAIATIKNEKIELITFLDNPLYLNIDKIKESKGLGAGKVIPPLLKDVNIFVAKEIGEGLKRNLEGSGILTIVSSKNSIDEIIKDI